LLTRYETHLKIKNVMLGLCWSLTLEDT
jgi:hypothetical protein